MAIQIQGFSGAVGEVDATYRAARISPRPLDAGVLGHYRLAASSGLLTGAGVTAGAPLFSARWGDASRLFLLHKLSVRLVVTTVFTAVQELGVDAVIARSFTVSDSVGTPIVLSGGNQKARTSMGSSLVTDMRIAAATLLTAGTRTLDAQPFAGHSSVTHDANAAAATAQLVAFPIGFDWAADLGAGEHPIVLATNEGIVVRNTVAFPAAGAARLWVQMAWAEMAAF